MTPRFGVFVPQGWRMDLVGIDDPVEQYEAMTRVARVADEGGWTSIWVYDHFHTTPTPELETTFECWTISATLARDTNRVRIGQMVGCNGYRNPALYAKIASTVDVASRGRLDAGIGAGWYEHEWRAYGYGFPETRERLAMLREAAHIIKLMWTEAKPTYSGTYYTIDGPINEPKGVQKPTIPLWIGGGGEQVTLKLVARYGDACNVGGGDPDTARHKLAVLRRHCETVGRDYDSIIRSTNINVCLVENLANAEAEFRSIGSALSWDMVQRTYLVGNAETVRDRIAQLLDAGIDYIIVYLPGLAYDQTMMRRFADEVIGAFQ